MSQWCSPTNGAIPCRAGRRSPGRRTPVPPDWPARPRSAGSATRTTTSETRRRRARRAGRDQLPSGGSGRPQRPPVLPSAMRPEARRTRPTSTVSARRLWPPPRVGRPNRPCRRRILRAGHASSPIGMTNGDQARSAFRQLHPGRVGAQHRQRTRRERSQRLEFGLGVGPSPSASGPLRPSAVSARRRWPTRGPRRESLGRVRPPALCARIPEAGRPDRGCRRRRRRRARRRRWPAPGSGWRPASVWSVTPSSTARHPPGERARGSSRPRPPHPGFRPGSAGDHDRAARSRPPHVAAGSRFEGWPYDDSGSVGNPGWWAEGAGWKLTSESPRPMMPVARRR